MARIRTEEEKEAARQAAKQAKKDQWLREQEFLLRTLILRSLKRRSNTAGKLKTN